MAGVWVIKHHNTFKEIANPFDKLLGIHMYSALPLTLWHNLKDVEIFPRPAIFQIAREKLLQSLIQLNLLINSFTEHLSLGRK